MFLLISIYIGYDIDFKLSKSTNRITYEETFSSQGIWKSLVIELLLNLASPSIFLEGTKVEEYNSDLSFMTEYQLNDLLLVFSLVRVYHIIKFFLLFSIFREQRAARVCAYNGLDNSFGFLIRCFYKNRPIFSLTVSLVMLVLIFGFQLHVLESPLSSVSG